MRLLGISLFDGRLQSKQEYIIYNPETDKDMLSTGAPKTGFRAINSNQRGSSTVVTTTAVFTKTRTRMTRLSNDSQNTPRKTGFIIENTQESQAPSTEPPTGSGPTSESAINESSQLSIPSNPTTDIQQTSPSPEEIDNPFTEVEGGTDSAEAQAKTLHNAIESSESPPRIVKIMATPERPVNRFVDKNLVRRKKAEKGDPSTSRSSKPDTPETTNENVESVHDDSGERVSVSNAPTATSSQHDAAVRGKNRKETLANPLAARPRVNQEVDEDNAAQDKSEASVRDHVVEQVETPEPHVEEPEDSVSSSENEEGRFLSMEPEVHGMVIPQPIFTSSEPRGWRPTGYTLEEDLTIIMATSDSRYSQGSIRKVFFETLCNVVSWICWWMSLIEANRLFSLRGVLMMDSSLIIEM